MKLTFCFMAWVFLGLSAPTAHADRFNFHHGYEVQVGGSFGGSTFELIDPSEGSKTRTVALNADFRIRHPRTPFAFEQTLILPHGMMSALLLDAWRADRWRAHLDLGFFIPFGDRHLSSTDVKRSWDLVLGLGVEALVRKRFVITADWRVF